MSKENIYSQQWLDELKQGSDPAFRLLYDECFAQLTFFADRILNDEEKAKEIAIDSFLKIKKSNKGFNSLQDIRSYLYVTVRNHCYDVLRMRNRRGVQVDLELNPDLPISKDEIALNILIRTEIIAKIHAEIEKLPENRKKVIQLYYLEGFKIEEIASTLGVSPEVIRSRKSKGLAQLRHILSDQELTLLLSFALCKLVNAA
jgi:RNA polymerase sigma factor (sigma-70 family)